MHTQEEINSLLWQDRYFEDEIGYPAIEGIQIPGKNGRIFSTYYRAGGEGLHPAILLCHGFPGNDQLTDMAQAFQRAGFHVMTFHYSGCWGSDGEYSLTNDLETTHTVLDYMLVHPELKIDLHNLFLLGHSMGGFVATHIFAARKELKAAVILSPANPAAVFEVSEDGEADWHHFREQAEEGTVWLSGETADKMIHEIKDNEKKFEFSHLAGDLTDRPLLLVGALRDQITEIEWNIKPLVDSVQKIPHPLFQYETVDTDHHYLDHRVFITERAAAFFFSQLKEKA